MIVERHNNEILGRFSVGQKTSKIQDMLDYLRYEELTSNSQATENDIDLLMNKVKKGRWHRIKEELRLNEYPNI